MLIHLVDPATGVLREAAYSRVLRDVEDSLFGITANSPDKFIVNPTLWYNIVPTKKGKLKAQARVMNSADYLSKKLGKELEARGWRAGATEIKIDQQKIDGYLEIESDGSLSSIDGESIFEFLYEAKKLGAISTLSPKEAFDFYFTRFCSNSGVLPNLPKVLLKFFKPSPARSIRVGLEFETGNIASSFRALMKLDHLFKKGLIDYGVFITSFDIKTTAAKIWPISNRNGSFTELANRRATAGLSVPLLKVGFQPDRLSDSAGYLGPDGKEYKPKKTGKTSRVDGSVYIQYSHRGAIFWRPQDR